MARNLLAENQSVKRAQDASTYILGWIAQIVAFVGGAYATNSWPGQTIRWVFELIPWSGFIPAVLIIWTVAWGIDIVNDLTPNQVAITYGFMGPILAVGLSGTLPQRITQWSNALQAGVGGKISGLAGNLGAGTLAIICIVIAVIVGRRVLAKQSAGKGARPAGGR